VLQAFQNCIACNFVTSGSADIVNLVEGGISTKVFQIQLNENNNISRTRRHKITSNTVLESLKH